MHLLVFLTRCNHSPNQHYISSLVIELMANSGRKGQISEFKKKILQMIHPSYFSDRIQEVHYKQINFFILWERRMLGPQERDFLRDINRLYRVKRSSNNYSGEKCIWSFYSAEHMNQQWQKCKSYGRNYFALSTWLMQCFTHHMNNKYKVLSYTKCVPLMK